jgi:hypothetical protein
MKNIAHRFILFLMLLVILTSTISASGNSVETGKISCPKQANHSEKKSCCDSGENQDEPGSVPCDNTACHCSSTVNVTVFINNFKLSSTNNFALLFTPRIYVQHPSNAVCLSIWQPPEIS